MGGGAFRTGGGGFAPWQGTKSPLCGLDCLERGLGSEECLVNDDAASREWTGCSALSRLFSLEAVTQLLGGTCRLPPTLLGNRVFDIVAPAAH